MSFVFRLGFRPRDISYADVLELEKKKSETQNVSGYEHFRDTWPVNELTG